MRWLFTLSALAVFITSGCQPSATTRPPDAPKKELEEAGEKLRHARDEYVAQLKIDMDRANQDIRELKEKASKASGEAKVKMDKRIQELEVHRDATSKHFDEVKADTKKAWGELQQGMDKSWGNLKDSIRRAKDEFQ